MNNALSLQNSKTMSSTEIALVTGKRKSDIHQDIKTQLFIGIYGLEDGGDYHHQQIQGITIVLDSREYWSEVLLDRYHSDILVSGYAVKYRAAIIKRWHELEANKWPSNYIESLQALLESEIAKQKLIEENAKLTSIIDNEFGYASILRASKYAKVGETDFNWRTLKSVAIGIGMPPKRVPSPRFDFQNIYPIKAFQIAYPHIDFDGLVPELLDDKELLVCPSMQKYVNILQGTGNAINHN